MAPTEQSNLKLQAFLPTSFGIPDSLNRKTLNYKGVPIGSIVVHFCGLYVGSYKVTPNRNYYGA